MFRKPLKKHKKLKIEGLEAGWLAGWLEGWLAGWRVARTGWADSIGWKRGLGCLSCRGPLRRAMFQPEVLDSLDCGRQVLNS